MAFTLNNGSLKITDGAFVADNGRPTTSSLLYPVTTLITATGSGNWMKPPNVTLVDVECWGAGGAGGGVATGTDNSAGAGGAGGQYVKKTFSYSAASQSIAYFVAGNTTGSTGDGATGRDTTWGANAVVAKGGAGGQAGQPNGIIASAGLGSTAGGIGDTINQGGNGGDGYFASFTATFFQGAGGGGAGSWATGSSASGTTSGSATADYGGAGGNGQFSVSTPVAASNGSIYAAGGGGAGKITGTGVNGGSGSQGLIRITYYNPPILDVYSGSALMAASVRKLTNSASLCMRVWRDSDNTTKDIGFQSNGLIDTGSLLSFAGTGSAYVVRWYNQMFPQYAGQNAAGTASIGNDFIPQWDFCWPAAGFDIRGQIIVSTGSLVTQNGIPAVLLNSSGGLTTGNYSDTTTNSASFMDKTNGTWMTYAVTQVADTQTRVLIRSTNGALAISNNAQDIRRNTTNIESIAYNQAQTTFTDAGSLNPGTSQFLAFVERKATSIEVFLNSGSTNGSTATTGTNTSGSYVLQLGFFGGGGPGTFPWSGSVQEFAHISVDPAVYSYIRPGIQADTDAFYNIF